MRAQFETLDSALLQQVRHEAEGPGKLPRHGAKGQRARMRAVRQHVGALRQECARVLACDDLLQLYVAPPPPQTSVQMAGAPEEGVFDTEVD